jgi:hypothetical protein
MPNTHSINVTDIIHQIRLPALYLYSASLEGHILPLPLPQQTFSILFLASVSFTQHDITSPSPYHPHEDYQWIHNASVPSSTFSSRILSQRKWRFWSRIPNGHRHGRVLSHREHCPWQWLWQHAAYSTNTTQAPTVQCPTLNGSTLSHYEQLDYCLASDPAVNEIETTAAAFSASI